MGSEDSPKYSTDSDLSINYLSIIYIYIFIIMQPLYPKLFEENPGHLIYPHRTIDRSLFSKSIVHRIWVMKVTPKYSTGSDLSSTLRHINLSISYNIYLSKKQTAFLTCLGFREKDALGAPVLSAIIPI